MNDAGLKAFTKELKKVKEVRMMFNEESASPALLYSLSVTRLPQTDKHRMSHLGPKHAAIIAAGGQASKRLSGADNFKNSGFGFVMDCMLARKPINKDLCHAILGRVRLP